MRTSGVAFVPDPMDHLQPCRNCGIPAVGKYCSRQCKEEDEAKNEKPPKLTEGDY
jgi:hypothetical protein